MGGRTPRRVAVVGSGVAGLTAAYVASRSCEVALYEADQRLGGHADTHQVHDPATGVDLQIDTGFIVHNRRTYPTLMRLFDELGVPTQPSEMSLSVGDDETGLEWAGALGPRGLFPTARHLWDAGYLRMLTEIPRFHRRARAWVGAKDDCRTLREFLDQGGFSAYFRRHFMAPLVAAVWSCDQDSALEYPASYLFEFLDHHGMLGVFGSPAWRTVTGGSRTYVDRVSSAITDAGGKIHLGEPVTSIEESPGEVRVRTADGSESYDAVVIATHPAQALRMLAAPTTNQRDVLGALPYVSNTAVLHTDTRLMPRARRAWASWNVRRPAAGSNRADQAFVTYDLTRLQRLPTPRSYLVTLGGRDIIDPASVIAERQYEHPLYTPESVAARSRLDEIDTAQVVFAGAYHGWGFHEDGARSGLAAVERLGLHWPEDLPARAAYDTKLIHRRRAPVRHGFSIRSRFWCVDLDAPRTGGPLRGTFEGRDHFTGEHATIREGLDAFLSDHGIDLQGGRAFMAAQPRAFGHCFNPISVHWAWAGRSTTGRPDATVVEVHNTYGDRHAYLLEPDEQGFAEVPKAMYVSPFHGVDGHYVVHVPPPDPATGRLRLAVTLHPDGGTRFDASLVGERAREPRIALAGLRGALLIRLHGVWLWLRRLPIQKRPHHD